MKKSPVFVIGLVFLLFGIAFSALGVGLFIGHREFISTAIPVEAVITNIYVSGSGEDVKHDVYVSYIVDGINYNERLDYYSSSMDKGDILTIYYNPSNPSEIHSGSNFVYLLFIGFSSIFGVIGICFIISYSKVKKKAKRLKIKGQLIYGKITNVYLDSSLEINGRNPYKVECGYLASNGSYFQFVSGYVWTNPQQYIGSPCPVYLDPNNPNDYYVDTEWLEKKLNL